MRPYLAQIRSDLRLMARDRAVLFFGLLFPMTFFFLFAQLYDAGKSPANMMQVIAMVLIIGVLGNGFMGGGMRTVQQRESNVLRRFKVTPAGPLPLIVAAIVSGVINFVPTFFLIFFFGRTIYHMPLPANFLSLCLFVLIGVVAFRAMGMIVAAVVNSMAEAQIVIQLLYLPMLFLSGATFPAQIMPQWVQKLAHFLPATYLYEGIRAIAIAGNSILVDGKSLLGLVITLAVGLFISVKLFRWEKEEKISGRSKLWILAVLAPFFVLGAFEAKTNEGILREKILARETARDRSILFNNVRIFVGDGSVIPTGAVLIRHGKIVEVFAKPPAETKTFNADVWDESGRTLLPGLIDMHVHLGWPGGVYKDYAKYMRQDRLSRNLAAYLYCGITAVRSTGDWLDNSLKLRQRVNSGEYLGAELFAYGPLFTAPSGHMTETLSYYPAQLRKTAEAQFVRMPKSPAEARLQVDELKTAGVDGIKAVLDSGTAPHVFNRLDTFIYSAIVQQATKDNMLSATHTGDEADVKDAVAAGTSTVEHGSWREQISEDLFAQMKQKQIAYDPTLSVVDAASQARSGSLEALDRPLVQRAAPGDLIADTRAFMRQRKADSDDDPQVSWTIAAANLTRAHEAGVPLIAGSDAGNMLILHGPTVQHELALWVKAGIPAAAALQAATYESAKFLRASDRIGLVASGRDASLLIVDGDPVQDITALEHIAEVFLKGEQVARWRLFDQDNQ